MNENIRKKLLKSFLVAAIGIFCIIRFFNLAADVPARITWSSEIYGDEGLYVRNAVAKIITGNWLLPMESNPIVVMPVFQFIEYVFFKIMGINLFSARFSGVLFFIGTMIFLYFIYRRFTSSIMSLGILVLVSCNHLLFVYSRLALNENLMLLFAVIAFYLSLIYHKHFILTLVMPFAIFLAVLSKISALSIWIPVIFVILYSDNGFCITTQKLKRIGLSFLLFFILCISYIILVIKPYHDYGGYYLAIVPIFPDSMHGISSVIYAVYKIFRNGYLIMHGIYCIGYIAGIIGMVGIFFLKRLPCRRLLIAFALWIIAYAIAGAIGGGYNPPRYYIFTIIPLISIMGFLVISLWSSVSKHINIIRVFLVLILLSYIVLNTGRTIAHVIHPEWSFAKMAEDIEQTIRKTQKNPVIITDIVDSFALASGMLVLNIETGPADKYLKFERYKPNFLITLGPITDSEGNHQYIADYAAVRLLKTYNVFHNHHNGKPVYFYQLIHDNDD
jgi:4-amino-4-deoxy-L-arabinose transferase-like glycosyltransferase